MISNSPNPDQELIDLTKDMLDTAIIGIKNLEQKGISMHNRSIAYDLFANTIVTCIIYLEASGAYIIHEKNKEDAKQ